MRPASTTPEADAIPELRRLVLGNRRAAVLDDLANGLPGLDAESIGAVLPEAVRLRAGRDSDLADALAPTVELGLTTSVQRNPKPVADAIFPIIFPAIRRAIEHALASSMQSVNQTLNYGVSWRAMRWRVEGWKTGLSFSEVVLKHTLRYRVEQVLLVHRESGLLLEHVTAPDVQAADPDLVSAMLSAIRQFVEDSFRVDDDDALDAIQMGDLTVWVEPGPHAILATVVRGQPPEAFREVMAAAIETVHRRFPEPLRGFSGDSSVFRAARPVLENCLETEYKEDARRTSPIVWLLLLLVLAGLGWWIFSSVRTAQRDGAVLEALAAAPGIEVIDSRREDGRLRIVALRDPMADDPGAMLKDAGLSTDDLEAAWSPYLSADPELVRRRAAAVLSLPATAQLRVDSAGMLVAEGIADAVWIESAREDARLVPGVSAVDLTQLKTPLQAAREQLERIVLRVEGNSTELAAGQAAEIAGVAESVRALARAATDASIVAVLEIVGHTDDVGGQEDNRALSLRRAQRALALLPRDLSTQDELAVRTVGAGASERLADGDHPPSRRVTFRVRLPGSENAQ